MGVSGTGIACIPNFNNSVTRAKYCTYTMIDQETDEIVDFQKVQVSEVNSSNVKEREGYKQCMENRE